MLQDDADRYRRPIQAVLTAMEPNPYQAPKPDAVPVHADAKRLLLAVGLSAMLCALFLQNVTVIGSYAPVLIAALALMGLANVCLVAAVWRGPIETRILVFLAAAGATFFIVTDFVRRAPYLF
jgi:hypothetical protein